MLHQEIIRAATVLAALLFLFSWITQPTRESRRLLRDCGIVIEPDRVTEEIKQHCDRYLREIKKYQDPV